MLPSNFQRGTPITADHLNMILDQVRRNTIRGGTGYTLNQTPYGTSLRIDQAGGGGGGGESGQSLCPYKISDVSEPKTGGGLTLKIQIDCQRIQPDKLFPAKYLIDIDTTTGIAIAKLSDWGLEKEGWVGVYLEIVVDQRNRIQPNVNPPYDKGVVLLLSDEYLESNSTRQRTYLGSLNVSTDSSNNLYISYIESACILPTIWPAPECPFLVEDYSLNTTGGQQKISIRSHSIQRHYPDGMSLDYTYVLPIPDTQNWWAVYCVMQTDQNGNILTNTGDITLGLFDSYQTSTATETYFLIGEVNLGYNESGHRVIEYIYNACEVPAIRGAYDSAQGIVIPRGSSANCPFSVTDASVESFLKVRVANTPVFTTTGARYPDGMSAGGPPFILEISQSCYIYCKLKYVPNDVVLDSNQDAITVLQSNNPLPNEVDVEYVLLATVTTAGSPATSISSINSMCMAVTPNPCNLAWK